jgi:hypothetical protein
MGTKIMKADPKRSNIFRWSGSVRAAAFLILFSNACSPDLRAEEGSEPKSDKKSEAAPVELTPPVVLVENGAGRAGIVIPPEPSRMNKLAAEELQTYIQRISGAKLPIATEPATDGGVNIFVGESEFTRKLGITAEGLESDAFVLRTGDNWLALVGDDTDYQPRELDALTVKDRARVREEWDKLTTPDFFDNPWGPYMDRRRHTETGWWQGDRRGSLNAVYEFLRRQGVLWYMPGEIGEVVPESTTIVAASVDDVVRPDFVLRHHTTRWDLRSLDEILWCFRLGLNYGDGFYGISNAHGLNNVTGRDETKAAYPAYYAVWDGKIQTGFGKSGAQRLSSEELFEATLRFVRASFDIYDEPAVEISIADNQGKGRSRSEHPDCVAQYTLDRERSQLSDYYWSFLKRVAEEIYKTHPDKYIIGTAYQNYSEVPLNIDRLPPNVIVCIARSDRHRLHQNALRTENLTPKLELREQWAEKVTSGKMYMWEYYLFTRPNRGDWVGVPVYFPSAIAEDLRHMKSLGVAGDFLEATLNESADTTIQAGAVPWGDRGNLYAPGFAHLNLYLTGRLYWDVDQDVNAMLDEYCEKFFGPAAKIMREFIAYCEKNYGRMSPATGEPEVRAHALDLLDKAQTQATGSPYRERVGFVVDYVNPMRLAQQVAERGSPAGPQYVASYQTRIPPDMKIDGELSENFWNRTGQRSFGDGAGSGPAAPTLFRVWFADDHLFLGVRCENTQEKESVSFLLGSPSHSFYEVGINRDGSTITIDHREGARADWTAPMQAAVHEGDGFWSAEIKLPINTDVDLMVDKADGVVGSIPAAAAPWVFDVIRRQGEVRRQGEGEKAPAISFSGGVTEAPYDPAQFGQLIVR